MPQLSTPNDPRVTRWLHLVAVMTFCLIVFGGFVRLTRAGLSIVEWNPVMGILPPLGDEAQLAEFSKYQQTPEFRAVNPDMTLDGYMRIFYIEWTHRLIARIAGLAVVVPLIVFLWRGVIPWRRAGPFIGIALLFGLQGFLGWFMVSSGLLNEPAVSHYRLTIHLLTALLLFVLTVWIAMDGNQGVSSRRRLGATAASRIALITLAVAVMQIAYGGLVAGLKAGHVSYSWPLMGGFLMPPGLFGSGPLTWSSLTASAPAVQWIHRWFAFAVLVAVVVLLRAARHADVTPAARSIIRVATGFVGLQILLGMSVLWLHVPVSIALLHQAVALAIVTALVVANHRVLRRG